MPKSVNVDVMIHFTMPINKDELALADDQCKKRLPGANFHFSSDRTHAAECSRHGAPGSPAAATETGGYPGVWGRPGGRGWHALHALQRVYNCFSFAQQVMLFSSLLAWSVQRYMDCWDSFTAFKLLKKKKKSLPPSPFTLLLPSISLSGGIFTKLKGQQ